MDIGDIPTVTERLRELVAEDVQQSSLREVAGEIGLDHAGLFRFLHGGDIRSSTLDRWMQYYNLGLRAEDYDRRPSKNTVKVQILRKSAGTDTHP